MVIVQSSTFNKSGSAFFGVFNGRFSAELESMSISVLCGSVHYSAQSQLLSSSATSVFPRLRIDEAMAYKVTWQTLEGRPK